MRLVNAIGGQDYGRPQSLLAFAWVGNVSTTSFQVKGRGPTASAITMRYSTNPGMTNALTVSGVEGSDEVWTFTASGLSDDTTYYYDFIGDNLTGKVHTWPSGTASFTIAAGSCAGDASAEYPGPPLTSNSIAYDRVREKEPLLFIQMGDLWYRNPDTTEVGVYRNNYRDVLTNSRLSHLVRTVPTLYMFDDHDFGPNDSDGTYTGKSVAQQAYREYVPHWTISGSGAVYTTFVIGRVRFIVLDVRSERSPNANTDNSSKTRIGTTQKTWLKSQLTSATEPLIVLEVGSWWGGTTGFTDGWDSFSTERQELAEYFEDNDLTEKLFLLGGDIHELIWDDGTNTQFDPASSDPGPPYAGFAPMDAGYNDFSCEAQETYQESHQQYGTLSFEDTGSQITVTAKGFACSDDGSEEEVFSHEVVYTG